MSFLNFLESLKETNPTLVDTFLEAFNGIFEEKPRKYGAGIFFVCPSTKKILLFLRANNGEDPGVWCSLGGKGESGESPIQTAIREVREESKIKFKSYHLDTNGPLFVKQNSPDFRFITYIATVDSEIQPKINEEHDAFGWFTLEEASKLPLHHGVTSILNSPESMSLINSYLNMLN